MTTEPSDTEPERGPRVLVAVDFSLHASAALAWAARYCADAGAHLVVLHVVHDKAEAPGSYRRKDDDVVRPLEDIAREKLDAYMDEVQGSIPALARVATLEKMLAVGLPATRIVEVAKREDIDHIVMGSHGRTGLAHVLLGSKAEHVVRLAPVPVTIVKAPAQ